MTMCRSSADGGRRCSGSSRAADADREAAEQRAQDTRDRVAAGEGISDILASRQAEISRRLLAGAVEEG
jgi:hypothetical protein